MLYYLLMLHALSINYITVLQLYKSDEINILLEKNFMKQVIIKLTCSI